MRVGSVALPLRVLRGRRGYRTQVLLRPDLQRAVARHGYCVADEAIDGDGIARLLALHDEVLAHLPAVDAERFVPLNVRTAALVDEERQRRIVADLEQVAKPVLARLAVGHARAAPTVFQSKPSSPDSVVDAHQDAILVDERTDIGVYVWIPLVDVDHGNGALYVVPGSHRFGIWPRLPSTGAELAPLRAAIERTARVLPLRAGQIVLFDHATWHGSMPNRSGERRVALGGVIRPGDRPGFTATTFDDTPDGQLELFRHPTDPSTPDLDFWRSREHVGRRERVTVTAGPRALELAVRIDGLLRPGAPGLPLDR